MKLNTASSALLAAMALAAAAPARGAVTFSGNTDEVITVTPAASTGLSAVYVLSSASGVEVTMSADTPASGHEWMTFGSQGGGYAAAVPFTANGSESTVTLRGGDAGYIFRPAPDKAAVCFWVVDYAAHECVLRSLAADPGQDCGQQRLVLDGEAPRITYYTVNGRGETLSRGLTLAYTTLALDEERREYAAAETSEQLEYVSGDIIAAGALCPTAYTLEGDRFQRRWGRSQTVGTPVLQPHSVAAYTWVEQTARDADNEISSGDDGSGDTLGGSAPVDITFTAAVTDAAVYREWQFAADAGFDIIDMRVNEPEVERVFNDYGTVYARFVCGNNDGSCQYESQTYVISIGESRLDCPNAFSPGASEGTNDVWKVSYKSITSFECHIFNRWGVEVASFNDPSQGWDGRYKGKLVPAGVYFYVITARGADDKKYKLSGDINIIGYKGPRATSAGSADQ